MNPIFSRKKKRKKNIFFFQGLKAKALMEKSETRENCREEAVKGILSNSNLNVAKFRAMMCGNFT